MQSAVIEPIMMNDFRRQWADTSSAVLDAVRTVGESGWYVLGKHVALFEAALAQHTGLHHAVGCANGLDALEMALRATGLEPGQQVLTTPLSAFATTLAIVRAGGVPVFVDVDESGQLDLARADEVLRTNPSIRYILPVHLFGHAMSLGRLHALAERFELVVIEDCCQAIGARSGGRAVGSVGDAGALSFYPTKNLGALGDGGAVLTQRPEVADSCRSLRDYGQTSKYVHDVPGLNSRLDEMHAAILSNAYLPRLSDWTRRRHAIAARYLAGMKSPHVKALPVPDGSESVWHLFPVAVAPTARDAFMDHLRAHGVQSGIHYPKLITDQKALSGVPCKVFGTLERASSLAASEVSLPIHPYLTDEEIDRVLRAVECFRPG